MKNELRFHVLHLLEVEFLSILFTKMIRNINLHNWIYNTQRMWLDKKLNILNFEIGFRFHDDEQRLSKKQLKHYLLML